MRVLQGILSESKQYYLQVREKIKNKLAGLSKGNVKERQIGGKKYFYLQRRIGKKVNHKYLGKNKPEEVMRQIKERKALLVELKKVNDALRIIKRSEGRRRG